MAVEAISPVFRTHTILNEGKSKTQGRPIYDEMEVVDIYLAGNRDTVTTQPAHVHSHWRENADGSRESVTYAQRWPDQYLRFKENKAQVVEGTPLGELPFLTEAKRQELRALKIHTAEQLSGLDDRAIKTLGIGGREMKNQATAYLENAKGSADITKLASENAALRSRIEALEADFKAGNAPQEQKTTKPVSTFDGLPDDEIKAYIKDKTGAAPRGTPSHETLVRMAEEAQSQDRDD